VSKNTYCCGALDYQIDAEYCPVDHNKKWREYSIRDFNSTSLSIMLFCPNCGTKFPTSLRDEWFDALEKEFGLDDPMESDRKKVPKEFLSDEWWKQLKLKQNEEEDACLSSRLDFPIRCLF
jgi:hypothetical protein